MALQFLLHRFWYFEKDTIIRTPPKMNITTKSAVLPLKEPSSNILQYLYVNIILKKKLNPKFPKKRNVVISLHNWYFFNITIGLKYSWNGDTRSNCWNKQNIVCSYKSSHNACLTLYALPASLLKKISSATSSPLALLCTTD